MSDSGETVKVKISNARLCGDASMTVTINRAEATGTIYQRRPDAAGVDGALRAHGGRPGD